MATPDGGVEETRMEAFVLSEIEAVEHVVVAGVGRQYLACLLTLKVVPGTTNLAEPALRFVRAAGSKATTVDEARKCNSFKAALLKGFASCNKMVYESCKRAGLQEKPAQLRRYTVLSEQWTKEDGTLNADGKVNRPEILSRYKEVIESMYGAVMTNKVEAARVQVPHSHSSLVASVTSSAGDAPGSQSHLADPLAAASLLPASQTPAWGAEKEDPVASTKRSGPTTPEPAPSPPPLPDIELPAGTGAIVKDRAPPPSALAKCLSSIKQICPCLGPHSQVLDDDILNPGHTVARKRPPPGNQKPKPAANNPPGVPPAPDPPAPPAAVPASPQDYPATPGGLYMSHGTASHLQVRAPPLFQTEATPSPPPPAPQGVFV